jgi:hypothetical protein
MSFFATVFDTREKLYFITYSPFFILFSNRPLEVEAKERREMWMNMIMVCSLVHYIIYHLPQEEEDQISLTSPLLSQQSYSTHCTLLPLLAAPPSSLHNLPGLIT